MKQTKHMARSKTVWANLIVTGAIAGIPGAREYFADKPETLALAFALINLLLRYITTGGVHVMPPKQSRLP